MLRRPPVFILGCPRSGTTILAELLDRHPDIKVWYEPYFVWDMRLPLRESDIRTAEEAKPEVARYVCREFAIFERKARGRLLVEKSPDNCFRIPFVHAVFPNAKWIHILRDGRDVALSIHREWEARANQIKERKYLRHVLAIGENLGEQPFWRNRCQEIWYELISAPSLRPSHLLNKSRWMGFPGWGPRFPGWREAYESMDLLEFNALQWVKAVKQVLSDRALLPPGKMIELRYEDLLARPEAELSRILEFIRIEARNGVPMADGLDRDNTGKWRAALSAHDQDRIEAVQGDLLMRLGYGSWR